MKVVVILLILLAISDVYSWKKSSRPILNTRPIIGVVTQPTETLANLGSSYIAASYVKYIEAAGGRVVPIFHNSSYAELEHMFNSVNAIFFPGGGADLDNTPLYLAGEYLYQLMIKANDIGDYFPMFGHCMGFELLSIITSQNFNILQNCTGTENVSMSLQFTSNVPDSYWLGSAPDHVIKTLSTQKVCLNNHMWGVYTSTFQATPSLNTFYYPLSTNVDTSGSEFISTWEGINYPVFAIQWHAEKNIFEWNPQEDINHSFDGIVAMQYFSNFLVQQARMSAHKFASATEEFNSLIYNYKPVYTEKIDPDFEQCYIF